jgi:hypothetical protein
LTLSVRAITGTPMIHSFSVLANILPANPAPGSLETIHAFELPPGLGISSNGYVVGTLTVPGTYQVLIKAQDVYGRASGTETMSIAAPAGSVAGAVITATPAALDLSPSTCRPRPVAIDLPPSTCPGADGAFPELQRRCWMMSRAALR